MKNVRSLLQDGGRLFLAELFGGEANRLLFGNTRMLMQCNYLDLSATGFLMVIGSILPLAVC